MYIQNNIQCWESHFVMQSINLHVITVLASKVPMQVNIAKERE